MSFESEQDCFTKQILAAINEVRKNPHSIVRSLQEQMHQVDDDNILNAPGRDPIQLEEGRQAVRNQFEYFKISQFNRHFWS